MALTAMSLLWNAADLLSRMHQQAEERGNSTQVLSPEDFDDLLRLLLGSLQVCMLNTIRTQWLPASASLNSSVKCSKASMWIRSATLHAP